jgi:glycosyltransferase involved in cell wall biosynthesis
LLHQTFGKNDYEVVIVSDGPDLATQAVVEKMDATGKRLRFLALSDKRGPAAARNAGWLFAKGSIIAFTDDDCLPDKNWLSEIFLKMKEDKAEAVSGRIIVPRSDKPTDYELNTAGLETAEFVTANCACTKAALITAGGFDERFSMAWREDSDLHFKLINHKITIVYLAKAIVMHPVREPSWGISLKEQKKTLFNALLYQKFPVLYRKRIQPVPPLLYYAIVMAFLLLLLGGLINVSVLWQSGLVLWLILTLYFAVNRLRGTRLTASNVIEMMLTSMLIPFLSLYWQWYGALKYRVLFI